MKKKCSKCKEIKSLDKFYKNRKHPDGLHYECKTCHRKYFIENKDKIKEYKKQYYLKNKDTIKEYLIKNKDKIKVGNYKRGVKYRLNHKEEVKEYANKYAKKLRDELSDLYIKQRLTSNSPLSYKDIPQWLIEAKREELQLKRIIRKEHDER